MPEIPEMVPVTDLRQDAASVLQKLRDSREPVVITQRGRAAAVLLSLEAYERVHAERQILRLLATADQILQHRQQTPLIATHELLEGRCLPVAHADHEPRVRIERLAGEGCGVAGCQIVNSLAVQGLQPQNLPKVFFFSLVYRSGPSAAAHGTRLRDLGHRKGKGLEPQNIEQGISKDEVGSIRL